MRLAEFLRLKTTEQVQLLYKNAVYSGKRRERTTIIVLYQLDGFYVEIFYLKYRWHIRHLHAFESVDLLEPYLPFVDLEELIND